MRVRIAPVALLALASCSRPAPPTPEPPTPPVVVTPAPADSSIPPPRVKPAMLRSGDKNPSEPCARFTFEDAEDENLGTGKAKLLRRNAPIRDGVMHLNGIYPISKEGDSASFAQVRTPSLVYDGFAVAVRFKADEFAKVHESVTNPVLVAGPDYRWFILSRNSAGKLVVELNQGKTSFVAESVRLEAGKWTVVACSVDLPRRKVLVFANGEKALEAQLPADFAWKVAEGDSRESDKVWLFINFSNGQAFKGSVGGLLVYDTALNADQMAKIPLKP